MDKKNSFQKKTFKKVLLRIKPYMPLVILSLPVETGKIYRQLE